MQLILANKNYSSWSLRAWLYLKESDLEFEEMVISLFSDDWNQNIRKYNPIGKAPALILDDGTRIWDSMAIIAFVQQQYPDALQFPQNMEKRAAAWSLAAEMHSGFLGIRNQLPMNLKQNIECPSLSDETNTQIDRVKEIWNYYLKKFDGPWLLGEFSIVDIMYAPIVTRFQTYNVPTTELEQDYMNRIRNRPLMVEWTKAALEETDALDYFDDLLPIEQAPITPG